MGEKLVTEVSSWKESFNQIHWLEAKTNKKIKHEFVNSETVTAKYFGGLYSTENFIRTF